MKRKEVEEWLRAAVDALVAEEENLRYVKGEQVQKILLRCICKRLRSGAVIRRIKHSKYPLQLLDLFARIAHEYYTPDELKAAKEELARWDSEVRELVSVLGQTDLEIRSLPVPASVATAATTAETVH